MAPNVDVDVDVDDPVLLTRGCVRELCDLSLLVGSVALILWGTMAPGLGAMSREVRIVNAHLAAGTIAKAAELSFALADSTCPTLDRLVTERFIDGSKTSDPWGHQLAVACDGGEVAVSSAGPDGELGTGDDISSRATRDEVRQRARAAAADTSGQLRDQLLQLAAVCAIGPALVPSALLPAAIAVAGS